MITFLVPVDATSAYTIERCTTRDQLHSICKTKSLNSRVVYASDIERINLMQQRICLESHTVRHVQPPLLLAPYMALHAQAHGLYDLH